MALLRWNPKPSKRIRDTSSSQQQTPASSSQTNTNGSNQS